MRGGMKKHTHFVCFGVVDGAPGLPLHLHRYRLALSILLIISPKKSSSLLQCLCSPPQCKLLHTHRDLLALRRLQVISPCVEEAADAR